MTCRAIHTVREGTVRLTDSTSNMQVISGQQMQRGFRHLVGAAADLRLDVPDAAAQIATFIARAVIDDVLPPAFVEDLSAGELQLG